MIFYEENKRKNKEEEVQKIVNSISDNFANIF